MTIKGYDPFLITDEVINKPQPIKMTGEQKKLKEVSEKLEGLFLSLVFRQMRKTVPKTSFLHGGFAEDIFQDLLWERYAQKAAKLNKFGIAEAIYNQYSKFVSKELDKDEK